MAEEAKKRYRVLLPIDIGDGEVHPHDAVIELDAKTAAAYAAKLIAVEEEKE